MGSTADSVTIVVLNAAHAYDAAWLAAAAFTGPDRESRGAWPALDCERTGELPLRATQELYESWTRGVADASLAAGTSVVALDGGKVVGTALNEDYVDLSARHDIEEQKREPEPGQTLTDFYCMELLRELRALYVSRHPEARRPGHTLHIAALAVAPSHGRRGLASALVRASEEAGRRAGYTVAVAEAANPLSQSVFRKNGYEVEAAISYAEWCHAGGPAGKRPYSATDPALSCALVLKPL